MVKSKNHLDLRTGPDVVGPGVGAVVGALVVGAGVGFAGGGVPAQVAVTPPSPVLGPQDPGQQMLALPGAL